MNERKTLVAYFSCSGVTKRAASALAEAAEADLYEIKPEIPYTTADLDWNNESSRSSKEMNDPASRPAIATRIEDMGQYGTIFVGFPVWWYIAPTIINTFLESYDFSGKNIVLFCTSGSSGLGDSQKKLCKSCADSVNWVSGKRLTGRESKDVLKQWVDSLNL